MDWNYLLWRFDGRIGRRTFWIAFMVVAAAEIVCHLAAYSNGALRLIPVISLAFGYPETAVFVKRGHDLAIPAWVPVAFYAYSAVIDFLFVIDMGGMQDEQSVLMTVLGLLWSVFAVGLIVNFGWRKGTAGPNQYGPDPLGPRFMSRHNGSGRD